MWLEDIDLYHYKARAYDPKLGRFLQTDPIGTAGGMNLYAYVGNDPANLVDPSGLEFCIVTGVRLEGYDLVQSSFSYKRECFDDPIDLGAYSDTIAEETVSIVGGAASTASPQGGQGHSYERVRVVCERELTDAEGRDLMSRYMAPNSMAGLPQWEGLHLVNLGIFPGGFVTTTFGADGLSGINTTTPVHTLVGNVVRGLIRDGKTYVTTYGYGNAGTSVPGYIRDWVNEWMGPIVFWDLDRSMAWHARHAYSGC